MERVAQYVNNLFADFSPENYQTSIRNSLQSVLWYCSSNMPEKVSSLEECIAHFNSRMILYNEMVIRPDPCSSDMSEGFSCVFDGNNVKMQLRASLSFNL